MMMHDRSGLCYVCRPSVFPDNFYIMRLIMISNFCLLNGYLEVLVGHIDELSWYRYRVLLIRWFANDTLDKKSSNQVV